MKNSFSELTFEELVMKKTELVQRLYDLRFKKAVGQLNNPIEIRTLRRSIARVATRLYNLVDITDDVQSVQAPDPSSAIDSTKDKGSKKE